jgi:hypothetical protein
MPLMALKTPTVLPLSTASLPPPSLYKTRARAHGADSRPPQPLHALSLSPAVENRRRFPASHRSTPRAEANATPTTPTAEVVPCFPLAAPSVNAPLLPYRPPALRFRPHARTNEQRLMSTQIVVLFSKLSLS